MNLLLKREQSTGTAGRVTFRLWAKTELDNEETAIVGRYRFDHAKVIDIPQPGLLRTAILVGLGALLACLFLLSGLGWQWSFMLGILAGSVGGYLYYDQNRQSVMFRDLMHGRHFACDSVVDLARKEAWLGTVASFLRQVMVSAQHWDGTETLPIEALSKQEAKFITLRGL